MPGTHYQCPAGRCSIWKEPKLHMQFKRMWNSFDRCSYVRAWLLYKNGDSNLKKVTARLNFGNWRRHL